MPRCTYRSVAGEDGFSWKQVPHSCCVQQVSLQWHSSATKLVLFLCVSCIATRLAGGCWEYDHLSGPPDWLHGGNEQASWLGLGTGQVLRCCLHPPQSLPCCLSRRLRSPRGLALGVAHTCEEGTRQHSPTLVSMEPVWETILRRPEDWQWGRGWPRPALWASGSSGLGLDWCSSLALQCYWPSSPDPHH